MLAGQSLEKRWHRVVGHVDRLATMAPQDRHRVRIEAKKLRYGCEFFASLYAVDTPRVVTGSGARRSPGRSPSPGTSSRCRPRSGWSTTSDTADDLLRSVGSAAPAVDEHRLVDDAVDAVRALAALDPFWR